MRAVRLIGARLAIMASPSVVSGEVASRQRAEQLAATLPPLMVAAERVASIIAQGVHGRRHGD